MRGTSWRTVPRLDSETGAHVPPPGPDDDITGDLFAVAKRILAPVPRTVRRPLVYALSAWFLVSSIFSLFGVIGFILQFAK